MGKYDYTVNRLPDVEIYGGDTKEWTVNLLHDDGTPYMYSELTGAACVFTIQKFGVSNSPDAEPLITKRLPIIANEENDGSNVSIRIPFAFSDTIGLRGKYIYQVEIIAGSKRLICQGYLHIIHNINN